MKILHLLAQLPNHTGSGVYFCNLVTELDALGHTNALIYAQQGENLASPPGHLAYPVNFMTATLPFAIPGMSDTMPYRHTRYSEMTPGMIQAWQAAFERQMVRIQADFQPDLVISHHLWFMTSLALDVFTDIPVVGISHGTDIRQAKHHPDLASRYVKNLDQLAAVFSLTTANKEAVAEIFAVPKKMIHITGNGFNPNLFHLDPTRKAQEGIHVLYAGKLDRSKGVLELAECYPALKQAYPDLHFHIAGKGDPEVRRQLEDLANHPDFNDFHLYPALPQKELAQWMQQYHIFALPSFYEGLPTIILEALASGMRGVVTGLEPVVDLLQGPILDTDLVSLVAVPKIIHQDQVHPDARQDFIQDLSQALRIQIDSVIQEKPLDPQAYESVMASAWPKLAQHQADILQKMVQAKRA